MKNRSALITLIGLTLFPFLAFSQSDLEPEPELINIFEEQAHASRHSFSRHRIRKQGHLNQWPIGKKKPILLYSSVPTDFLPTGDVYWNNNNFPLRSLDPMKFYRGPLPMSVYYVPKEGFQIISSRTNTDFLLPIQNSKALDIKLR
ncbi:MAG: hypothetical protein AB8F78_03330 [Saprospiraceae bacterium]